MILSILWVILLLLSVLGGLFLGDGDSLTAAALEGAESGIRLCISLGGSMCLFCGLAKAMEQAGLIRLLGRWMRPLFSGLFPRASRDEAALGYLTSNLSANLLGLGNAATPLGLAAVGRMKELSGSEVATDEMCRLIVMNTASVQLLPTTVASLRASLGARAPLDLLPAVWISSLLSVSAGLLAAFLMGKKPHA